MLTADCRGCRARTIPTESKKLGIVKHGNQLPFAYVIWKLWRPWYLRGDDESQGLDGFGGTASASADPQAACTMEQRGGVHYADLALSAVVVVGRRRCDGELKDLTWGEGIAVQTVYGPLPSEHSID